MLVTQEALQNARQELEARPTWPQLVRAQRQCEALSALVQSQPRTLARSPLPSTRAALRHDRHLAAVEHCWIDALAHELCAGARPIPFIVATAARNPHGAAKLAGVVLLAADVLRSLEVTDALEAARRLHEWRRDQATLVLLHELANAVAEAVARGALPASSSGSGAAPERGLAVQDLLHCVRAASPAAAVAAATVAKEQRALAQG